MTTWTPSWARPTECQVGSGLGSTSGPTCSTPYTTFFAYLVAVLETLIALALIVGFARKVTYEGAIVLSLLIWGTAEGFGGPYTSGASDIGTAIIYALMFAALLSMSYDQGPAPHTVDVWLERRIGWWHWVAEIGAHNHHPQYAPTSAEEAKVRPRTGHAQTQHAPS